MSETLKPSPEALSAWADNPDGPVALCLSERLVPIEGPGGVVFPPTFANIGYVVDDLPDGSRVALLDSVGSQANRMEPLFKSGEPAALVPHVTITAADRAVSIFDVGHRLADALLRCSDAQPEVSAAFAAYQKHGDASLIAKLAPTSLVFGAWDSRDAGVKIPRLVNATIRAWGAAPLNRAAQYFPPVDYKKLEIVAEAEADAAEASPGSEKKNPLSQRGFLPVPSGLSHGGIVADSIRRDVLLNLVALRALNASTATATPALRRYVLGLALVAVLAPQNPFLRQGCLLTADPAAPSLWELVERSGKRTPVALEYASALAFAQASAQAFGVGPACSFTFNKAAAKKDADEARKKGKKTKAAAQGEG